MLAWSLTPSRKKSPIMRPPTNGFVEFRHARVGSLSTNLHELESTSGPKSAQVDGTYGPHGSGGGISLAASTPGCLHRPSPDRTKVAENQQPGTRSGCSIGPPSIRPRYRCPWVEGYASRTRVMAGESISFFVSTQPASHFHIDIYRWVITRVMEDVTWVPGGPSRERLNLRPTPEAPA